MRKGFKLTAVMAGLLLATAGTSGVFANCTTSVMPVFQCGFVGFFAPPPAVGSPLNPTGPAVGNISAVWWQLGYGNNNVNNGVANVGTEGTGIAPTGVFSGNDSGLGTVYLTDADSVLPQYADSIPNGSLCSNFENSWAGVGMDGCSDNARTTASTDNDDKLNPYFSSVYGAYEAYYTDNYQIDYPMAFLVRESTNRFFSLAFVASKARVESTPGVPASKATDISENFYDLATVSNGDPNPVPQFAGRNNMIPWQRVPKPRVDSVTGTTPGTPRQLALSWDNIRLVHDQSTRPCGQSTNAAGVPAARTTCPVNGGVGVLNQMTQAGGICRFQIQTAPVTTATPDPSTLVWANAGAEIACGGANALVTANLTVNPDTAVRVRTILGKKPRTVATTLANARIGASGDLSFEATDCKANNCVNSAPLLIVGGGLVSEQAVETVAARNKNAVTVSFRTTSELTVSSIDILGKGDAVLKTVACKQCTTGIGDDYSVLLTGGDLKGSKELKVRLNGPGAVSSPFPIQ